jgi:bifunctional non-homologous end joining protein LigD
MAALEEYRRKRDFEQTPEPAGRHARAGAEGRRYVIHKHAARRLHYDLRLEEEGVLRSWALPKGPSLAPGERRLAVEVEDHPLEYADFEGVIPEGEYGGGTVMLWDRGVWTAGRKRSDDRLDIELVGEKLRGAWTLARLADDAGGTNWLMIRRRSADAAPLVPGDASVLTGRSMEEIAAGAPPSLDAVGGGVPTEVTADAPGEGSEPPEELPLQLATLVAQPPDGEGYLHEIKLDGYRLLARVADGRVRLLTRNGHDWSDRFPELARDLALLPDAVVDGEAVILDRRGVSRFEALQGAIAAGSTGAVVFHAFDLLWHEGVDLRSRPQLERKEALQAVLAEVLERTPRLRYTDHLVGLGAAFFARACRAQLEGIVSKRLDAPYRGGRGRAWLKVKCPRSDTFVVGGFTAPAGSRAGFGALLLGERQGDELHYVGRVGSGFGDRLLRRLHEALRARERPDSPFAGPPPDPAATFVEPELVVEVAYTERTAEGRVRHPVFRGFRDDLSAGEAERRAPAHPEREGGGARRAAASGRAESRGGSRSRRGAGGTGAPTRLAGVRLTNPDRVLYPEQGITKRALAEYYLDVAEHILPEVEGRPLSLVRCPQGHEETCFFQKHPGTSFAPSLPRVAIPGKEDEGEYAYVREAGDLVALVQAGVLEIHVWGSRVDELERPDRVVLDLDPSPEVAWGVTRGVATELRDRLAALGLAGFLRTTGGKGLHVVVPLQPAAGWDEVKGFARALCEAVAADDPKRLTTTVSLAKRRGKVYLDYLRNGRGATAIASYSTRARPGAPVAVPLRWSELRPSLSSERYTLGNVRRRLASLRGDPWQGFAEAAVPLEAEHLQALGAGTRGRGRRSGRRP